MRFYNKFAKSVQKNLKWQLRCNRANMALVAEHKHWGSGSNAEILENIKKDVKEKLITLAKEQADSQATIEKLEELAISHAESEDAKVKRRITRKIKTLVGIQKLETNSVETAHEAIKSHQFLIFTLEGEKMNVVEAAADLYHQYLGAIRSVTALNTRIFNAAVEHGTQEAMLKEIKSSHIAYTLWGEGAFYRSLARPEDYEGNGNLEELQKKDLQDQPLTHVNYMLCQAITDAYSDVESLLDRFVSRHNSLFKTWTDLIEGNEENRPNLKEWFDSEIQQLVEDLESLKEKSAFFMRVNSLWMMKNGFGMDNILPPTITNLYDRVKSVLTQSEAIVLNLLNGFADGAIDPMGKLLEGSVFVFHKSNMANADALLKLKEFSKAPEQVLRLINSSWDNVDGFPVEAAKDLVTAEFWTYFSPSYVKEWAIKVQESEDAIQKKLDESLDQLIGDARTAGLTWRQKWALYVGHGPKGLKCTDNRSYVGGSLTTKNGADNFTQVFRDDEMNPLTAEGRKFLSVASSEGLNMPMLVSSSGGMQFVSPVFLKVFQAITEKVIDIKAYIVSAHSSSVRVTLNTEAHTGTQIHVLMKDGKPVMKDGKPVAVYSAAEGSHWFSADWMKANHLGLTSCQIRVFSRDFMENMLAPANESLSQAQRRYQEWVSETFTSLSFIGQEIFYREYLNSEECLLNEMNSIGWNPANEKWRSQFILSNEDEVFARTNCEGVSWNPYRSGQSNKLWTTKDQELDLNSAHQIILRDDIDMWLGRKDHIAELEKTDNTAWVAAMKQLKVDLINKFFGGEKHDIEKFVNVRLQESPGRQLRLVVEGPANNVKLLGVYTAMVGRIKATMNTILYKPEANWDSFGAKSAEDFFARAEAGTLPEVSASLQKEYNEFKLSVLPKLIKSIKRTNKWGNTHAFSELRKNSKAKKTNLGTWTEDTWARISCGYMGHSIIDVKNRMEAEAEVPVYDKENLFGYKLGENKGLFVKGTGVANFTQWTDIDGKPVDGTYQVFNFRDGVKCHYKAIVEKIGDDAIRGKYEIVDFDDPDYGVGVNGIDSFETRSIIVSQEVEEVSVGILRIFKTGKVSVTGQFLQMIPTSIWTEEGSSEYQQASKESSEDFIQYWTEIKEGEEKSRWDYYLQLSDIIRSMPRGIQEVEKITDFWVDLKSPEDEGAPLYLYQNLMYLKAVCIDGPNFWDKILERLASGRDGDQVEIMSRLGFDHCDSQAYRQSLIEMIESSLEDACKGSIVKGDYFVVQNFELIPDRVFVIDKKYREGNKKGRDLDGCGWRFPIATSTSVQAMTIWFSDDPRILSILVAAGISDEKGNMADVMLMNSSCKVWFQQDDDGDQFGCLRDPKKPSAKKIAKATDLCKYDHDGTQPAEDAIKAAKGLFKYIESWVVISMTKLRRTDFPSCDIEMETIKGGKADKKTLDKDGRFTEDFAQLASEDGQGPTGLASDHATVVIDSGLSGHMFMRVMRADGYILQHCIDSAKKNKLVIPPYILLSDKFWIFNEVTQRYEMISKGNEIVIEWNRLWGEFCSKKSYSRKIATMEKEYSWLPTRKQIFEAMKTTKNLFHYAPPALLEKMSECVVPAAFGKITIAGKTYPVPPTVIDCWDSTRYIEQHIFSVFDPEGNRSWKQWAPCRKISILEYVSSSRKKITVGGKDFWVNDWSEIVDADGYANFWTENVDDGGYAGIETKSIPVFMMKTMLRLATERIFRGKENLDEERKRWLDIKDAIAEKSQNGEDFKKFLETTSFGKEIVRSEMLQEYQHKDYFSAPTATAGHWTQDFLFESSYENKPSWAKWELSKLRKQADRWAINNLGLARSKEVEIPKSLRILAKGKWKSLTPDKAFEFKTEYIRLLEEDKSEEANEMMRDLRDALYLYVVHQMTRSAWDKSGKVYGTNIMQRIFTNHIHRYFHRFITANGKKPDEVYQIPKSGQFAFREKPYWYRGTDGNWKSVVMGIIMDMTLQSLKKLGIWSNCGFTQMINLQEQEVTITKEFEFEGEKHKLECLDQAKLTQVIKNYSNSHTDHVKDGERVHLADCTHCMAEIRKQTTAIDRFSINVKGSEAWKQQRDQRAGIKTSKTCLHFISKQCEDAADIAAQQAAMSENTRQNFENYLNQDNIAVTEKQVKAWTLAYGSDKQKAAMGITSSKRANAYEEFSRIWNTMPEIDCSQAAVASSRFVCTREDYLRKLDQVTDCDWFELPTSYLLETLKKYKEVAFEKSEKKGKLPPGSKWLPLSLEEWHGQHEGKGAGKRCVLGVLVNGNVEVDIDHMDHLISRYQQLADQSDMEFWMSSSKHTFVEEAILRHGCKSTPAVNITHAISFGGISDNSKRYCSENKIKVYVVPCC